MKVKRKISEGVMAKITEVARRVNKVRGDRTQADFATLLQVTQPMVSSWEAGRDLPSAEMYVRLANAAADANRSDDCALFLEQAGLRPGAVVSVADTLLKKGEVKMDAILATAENKLKDRMGDQKELEDQGKVVLIPPFSEGASGTQQPLPLIPVPAFLVPHKASTYYITAQAPSVFQVAGRGVAPGDIIVFDAFEAPRASEAQLEDFEKFVGEELLVRVTAGEQRGSLFLGRVGFLFGGRNLRHLILAPLDVHPANWDSLQQGDSLVKLGDSHGTPVITPHGAVSRYDWHQLTACQVMGKFIGRFSTGALEHWKRQAMK